MGYLGNTPGDKFLTLEKQVFTTSATDTYLLDREISSANDIELFLNNVRQEPTTAYTISGTTLTLASAITSSDSMYCVYQGRAVGTTKPADNTVTNDMLVSDISLTPSQISLGDNEKALFGTGNDLEIYHDGSNSYVVENGTGDLYLQANNSVFLQQVGGSETYAKFTKNSSVELYHDNSKKFETTSSGVTITGDLSVSGDILTPYFFGWGVNSASNASGWRNYNFGTEEYDTDNAFTHTTGVFTAPETCLMAFFAGHQHVGAAHNEYLIRITSNSNGTIVAHGVTNHSLISCSCIYKVTQNEVIRPSVYHNNTSHNDAGGRSSFFGGFKIT